MTKSKSHWLAVKVTFDKPVTKGEARRIAAECFKGADQYPDSYRHENGPEQMWLRAFRTKLPEAA